MNWFTQHINEHSNASKSFQFQSVGYNPHDYNLLSINYNLNSISITNYSILMMLQFIGEDMYNFYRYYNHYSSIINQHSPSTHVPKIHIIVLQWNNNNHLLIHNNWHLPTIVTLTTNPEFCPMDSYRYYIHTTITDSTTNMIDPPELTLTFWNCIFCSITTAWWYWQ